MIFNSNLYTNPFIYWNIINNEFFMCGTFMDQVDFNPSILDNPLISNGVEDVFVLKFGTANCSPNATSPLYLSIDFVIFPS